MHIVIGIAQLHLTGHARFLHFLTGYGLTALGRNLHVFVFSFGR